MERLRSLTNLHHLWSILRIGRVCYAKYFEISLTLYEIRLCFCLR